MIIVPLDPLYTQVEAVVTYNGCNLQNQYYFSGMCSLLKSQTFNKRQVTDL